MPTLARPSIALSICRGSALGLVSNVGESEGEQKTVVASCRYFSPSQGRQAHGRLLVLFGRREAWVGAVMSHYQALARVKGGWEA